MRTAVATLPRLHIVTDDAVLASPAFLATATSLLHAAGARTALHLRGHATSGATLFELACALATAARSSGAQLVINDRVDVALACNLAAVQLGRRSLPPGVVRRLLPSAIIGVSVHAAAEIEAAAGTDLVLAGTIYESASHAGARGAGTGFVREASAFGIPVVAIGGVTPDRVASLAAAGAWGVAVLGGILRHAQPVAALNTYIAAIAAAYGTE